MYGVPGTPELRSIERRRVTNVTTTALKHDAPSSTQPGAAGRQLTADTIQRKQDSVTIRLADRPEDVVACVRIAEAAHGISVFRDLPFDAGKVEETVRLAMSNAHKHCLLLAQRRGTPVGGLYGTAGAHMFSSAIGATVVVVHVLPEYAKGLNGGLPAIKLLHGFHRWANGRGAEHMHLNVNPASPPPGRTGFLGSLGLFRRGEII